MAKFLTVEKFLCCFELTTGGYFCGIFGAIFTFLMFVLSCVTLNRYDSIVQLINKTDSSIATSLVEYKSGKILKWPGSLIHGILKFSKTIFSTYSDSDRHYYAQFDYVGL